MEPRLACGPLLSILLFFVNVHFVRFFCNSLNVWPQLNYFTFSVKETCRLVMLRETRLIKMS